MAFVQAMPGELLTIPEDAICPISQQVMEDPVVCADGHSYERAFIQKWLALGKRSSPKTNMSLAHTTLIPNLNLRSIIESIKIRMPAIQSEQIKSIKEMQDLEAIVRSLMEDQGKLAVTCIDSQRPPGTTTGTTGSAAGPGGPGAPYDAPAPPPPPVGAPLTQPIPVVLNLLKHDSKEVCERALGLIDALVASNPLHRDAVWHNGGIPLVVTMLKDGPPEQLQRACSLLQTLSSQREAQMAVAWAGAIPILVQHLNHDLSRVRVEAARALWSLAQNNMDNQTSILQQDGLRRLVALLQGAAEAQEPALLLLLALSQGHEQQDNITRAGAIPPLIGLLDRIELRELAAAVLAKLAHEHEDNQSAIGAATGAVPKLIKLLSDESPSIRETSAGLLHALVAGGHGKNVMSISRSGGIRPSLELLKDQNPGTREDATGLLSILATNADNRAVIAKMGAIPLLIDVVNDTDHVAPAARKHAATALGNLAVMNSSNKEAIGQSGGIHALVNLLSDGDALVRERAASALGTLCVLSDQNKSWMVEAGAIPLLVELLKDEISKKPAVVVLRSLAEENEVHRRTIKERCAALKVTWLGC